MKLLKTTLNACILRFRSIWSTVFVFSDDLGLEVPNPGLIRSFLITIRHFLFRPVSSSQSVLRGHRPSGVMKPIPFVLSCLFATTLMWWIQGMVIKNREIQWFPKLLTLRSYDKDRFYKVFPELSNVSFQEALIQEILFEAANDSKGKNVISEALPKNVSAITSDYIIRRIAKVDQDLAKDYQSIEKVNSISDGFESFWQSNGYVFSLLVFGMVLHLLFKNLSVSLAATISMYAYLSQTWITAIHAPLSLVEDLLLERTVNGEVVSSILSMMLSPIAIIIKFVASCFPFFALYKIYGVKKTIFMPRLLLIVLPVSFILTTVIWYMVALGWHLFLLRDDPDTLINYRRVIIGAFKSLVTI